MGPRKELDLGYSGSLALVTVCLKFKLDMASSIEWHKLVFQTLRSWRQEVRSSRPVLDTQ